MPGLDELHAEMLRTRDRLHNLEGAQAAGIAYQRQTLREMRSMREHLKAVEERTDALARADEIAAAVRSRLLSWPVKIVGLLATVTVLAGGLKGLIQ